MKRLFNLIVCFCFILMSIIFIEYTAIAEETINGVYYIQNVYSNLYMHVQDDSINNTTPIEQDQQDTSTPRLRNIGKLSQLWMIKPISIGVYSIRPMHKLDMALTYGNSGTYANITPASTNDSELANNQKWLIKTDSAGGYSIQPYANFDDGSVEINGMIGDQVNPMAKPVNNDVELSLLSMNTNVGTIVSGVALNSSAGSCWRFIADSVEPGVILHSYTRNTKKDDVSSIVVSSYSMTNISQQFTWSSSNNRVATVDNGLVTAEFAGQSEITFISALGIENEVVVFVDPVTLSAESDLTVGGVIIEGYGTKTATVRSTVYVTVDSISPDGKMSISNIDGAAEAQVIENEWLEIEYYLSIAYIKHNNNALDLKNCETEFIHGPVSAFVSKSADLDQNLTTNPGDVISVVADLFIPDSIITLHTATAELELS